jgi:hypothetical protein
MDNAATGAGNLTGNLNAANKAAEKLKRTTAGFDELNIMANNSTSSGSGSPSGSIKPSTGTETVGTNLVDGFGEAEKKIKDFATKLKKILGEVSTKAFEISALFTPSIEAWGGAFDGIPAKAAAAFEGIKTSLSTLWNESLVPFGEYIITEFTPNITNSFSENIAPIFNDVLGWAIDEFKLDFERMCQDI